jgi:DNA (cytosine-5)-methyltransferase 1
MRYRAISLFSGAGGMDVGFKRAGFDILWANDIDKDACDTYAANIGKHIECGDLRDQLEDFGALAPVDVVFGGPPCQGFSVAGKMNADDPRSRLLMSFLSVVEKSTPKVFVCENVKALATLAKWKGVRERFLSTANRMGYLCDYVVVNAKDYGVPQNRERVFFIGRRAGPLGDLEKLFSRYLELAPSVRDVIKPLGKAESQTNNRVCRAKITLATNPVMRKSPYAGMLFNGMGRPVRLDGPSSTLPASMGGNKTPIIDEEELFEDSPSWIEEYHKKLQEGIITPRFTQAPKRLRRLTIDEALRIQTFPDDYIFKGRNASIYKQIGNAVPCQLAYVVAKVARDVLAGKTDNGCQEVAAILQSELVW